MGRLRLGIRACALLASLALVGCRDDGTTDQLPGLDPRVPSSPGEASAPPAGVTTAGDAVPLRATARPVVIPDTTPATAWLERVAQLEFDAGTARILALNEGSRGVVEITLDGRLALEFHGGVGGGPGEIRRAEHFAFDERMVVIHDRGNSKLIVFDRADGAHLRDIRLPHTYSDLALAAGGTKVYLVPGSPGHAFDVLDLGSEDVEPIGSLRDLPLFCDRPSCEPRREFCTGCRVEVARDSLVVVANTDTAMIVTFNVQGRVAARLPFQEANPLLRRWSEEDRPRLEEMRAEAPPGVVQIKSYFTGLTATADGQVAVSVIPSHREWRERGNELWVIDPITGHHLRFLYPERRVGFLAAFAGGDVVGYHPVDGGIYLFHSAAAGGSASGRRGGGP